MAVPNEHLLHFYDEPALLERLSGALKRRAKEVIFLVGSPLSAPNEPGKPGVPGVEGVIDLIRHEFNDNPSQLTALEQELASAGENKYQAAFQFLQGRRGQQAANEIIREAVLAARQIIDYDATFTDEECLRLELDNPGWTLSPGMDSLGKLLTSYPERFGKTVLTTNFDPLIEVSARRAGGRVARTTLHADGDISQTQSDDCHIIHLHGYWYGSDTLHTNRQLIQSRPHLKDSLGSLLRRKLFVVCGYGGWDDVFGEALRAVSGDDTAYPDIIWTFYEDHPHLKEHLYRQLAPGLDRGRVTLYAGIDCHRFLPRLYAAWEGLEPGKAKVHDRRSNPVRVSGILRDEILDTSKSIVPRPALVIEGDVQDRPPVTELCVGRERELSAITSSEAKVIFVTGLGGQGKSTLAARYFSDRQRDDGRFSIFVWRDCKEESERFENQLASIILALSAGRLSRRDLSKLDTPSLVELLLARLADVPVLMVFDNVDHYVDLTKARMTGGPNILIKAFLRSNTPSQVVFTCRPTVHYGDPLTLSQRLEGISVEATLELFAKRRASATSEDIRDAHELTVGHAFWLDLLAIQVAKVGPAVQLKQLLEQIRSGEGVSPTSLLNSIWKTLHEREHTVLRAMAETVKPETETQIANYLDEYLNYNRVSKALKTLRALNLVVVKRGMDGVGQDLLELHPLVRQFVRSNFKPDERRSFIDAITAVYRRYIGRHRLHLSEEPSLSVLEHWTQTAELDSTAGRVEDAIAILAEAAIPFSASAYPGEYCRIVRILLKTIDWTTEYVRYKGFDQVFLAHIDFLSYLGEHAEVDRLLDQYETTVPDKDVRFVRYCGARCGSNWVKKDYVKAVEWGTRGKQLQDASNVDMQYNISHVLALAERDAGQPEVALPTFLAGRSLSEVLDPDEIDVNRQGHYYGNIGRCLHFMGQIDGALTCYQKSAVLVEKDRGHRVRNQGYIRTWIGELLAAREQYRLAELFFRAAYLKWSSVSPQRATEALALAEKMKERVSRRTHVTDEQAEKICLEWIAGNNLDAIYS